MKKLIIIVVTLLFSFNANCQWYYKTYGVKSLSMLTNQQLEIELNTAKGYTGGGLICSLLGAVGLWGASAIIDNAYDSPEWETGLARGFGGVILLIISMGVEVTGIIFIITGISRSTEINKLLKTTQLKVGLMNVPANNVLLNTRSILCPGLSVTFNF